MEKNRWRNNKIYTMLIFNIGNQKYLIDTDASVVRPFDENELTEKRAHFIAYKDLSRGGFDYYDGR